jgi:hypothetical protein
VGPELDPRHLGDRCVTEVPEELSYLAVGQSRVLLEEVDPDLSRQAPILKKLLSGKTKSVCIRPQLAVIGVRAAQVLHQPARRMFRLVIDMSALAPNEEQNPESTNFTYLQEPNNWSSLANVLSCHV